MTKRIWKAACTKEGTVQIKKKIANFKKHEKFAYFYEFVTQTKEFSYLDTTKNYQTQYHTLSNTHIIKLLHMHTITYYPH